MSYSHAGQTVLNALARRRPTIRKTAGPKTMNPALAAAMSAKKLGSKQ
jgi:hypothetical protein